MKRLLLSVLTVAALTTGSAYSASPLSGSAACRGEIFNPINDPITDATVTSSSSGGGFGLSKMMSWLMVGSMVFQLGGSPWNVNNVMANARHMNPMQLMILMNMLSGLIF